MIRDQPLSLSVILASLCGAIPPTDALVKFFSAELAEELVRDGMQADLLAGNNVLAKVPDPRGFVRSMKPLLKRSGMELERDYPYLMRFAR